MHITPEFYVEIIAPMNVIERRCFPINNLLSVDVYLPKVSVEKAILTK